MASQVLVASPLELASAELLIPAVLVIDDDIDCIGHCVKMLDELGYRHHCAMSAQKALEYISQDPTIQIILADMQMPSMDGFVLIEEARARASTDRAIAAIMLTEKVTPDLAIKGLHIEAVDLLCKPLDFGAYSTALRRAMRYLSVRKTRSYEANLSSFGQQLSRLISVLEGKTLEPKLDSKLSDKEMSATLRAIISARSLRNRFFAGDLFADPAWDILLDLTRAKLDNQDVSVSSVCIAASVPMSTALRWVRQMTENGMLRRWTDPKDRRRDLIALTDATATHMRDYISAAHTVLQKI